MENGFNRTRQNQAYQLRAIVSTGGWVLDDVKGAKRELGLELSDSRAVFQRRSDLLGAGAWVTLTRMSDELSLSSCLLISCPAGLSRLGFVWRAGGWWTRRAGETARRRDGETGDRSDVERPTATRPILGHSYLNSI